MLLKPQIHFYVSLKTYTFLQCIVLGLKVFPAIRKYAKEHGASGLVPIVMTTCDIKQSICTHYVVRNCASVFI